MSSSTVPPEFLSLLTSNCCILRQGFLTKGDNNENDDVVLYPEGRTLVNRSEVVGFVRGYVPWLGWFVIGFQDNIYGTRYLAIAIVMIVSLID